MWQIDHSREESVERKRAFKPIPAAPLLVHRREPDRAGEQQPQHVTARSEVARQEPAPVGELGMEPTLEGAAVDHRSRRRTRRQFRAEEVCAGIQARQAVQQRGEPSAPADGLCEPPAFGRDLRQFGVQAPPCAIRTRRANSSNASAIP
jgi:hypothetical protein